ncbi:MAG: hypothetical protein CMJ64_06965 [Planctomycetaceae bacterium]|nr:hypothetical protein [Planctomycetaceae bacterium]
MSIRFFDRRVKLFGNVAVVILCAIFFLVPFAMRGARKSVEKLENNIKDWLPSDFPETKDLEWFGEHFVGERFVLVTWPGCTSADQRFQLFVRKLENELQPPEPSEGTTLTEAEKARRLGDRLGLFATGKYHENWGGLGEKWLQGDNGNRYFITPAGELYRWDGDANVGDFVKRKIKKAMGGEIATGELIAQLGSNAIGQANPYHADPRRVSARFFNSIRTGPMLLEEIAAENGPLWPVGTDVADEDKPLVARQTAFERLTGTLFGPAVPEGFDWEERSFLELLPAETKEALPFGWEERFAAFVERLVEKEYSGDKSKLFAASRTRQTKHWDALFTKLRVEAPPRQTCAIVTLSEPGKRDLARVLGRPLLGKPQGKLLDLAISECNVRPDDLKLGGPPVDNVAIDEEGTITLVRLVGFSAIVGVTLSLLCFRSVKVTMMVFFVGGVSAVAALAIVFWSSAIPIMEGLSSVDAVLMSMPALVYVLGLSGAVHIVNYYREAVHDQGVEGAAERALSHAWGPCTLAAFTTALGLISLFTSNLMPIKKFGLFSALGVMTTLLLLFFYLPSALTIWPFVSAKREEEGEPRISFADRIEAGWLAVGRWVVGHHGAVAVVCVTAMIVIGLGLTKIQTEVQLLKLFDPGSKIIADYRWLENNFGRLVPMELVVQVKPELIRPSLDDIGKLKEGDPQAYRESFFQLTLLERMELIDRIQEVCEQEFGEEGRDIIGNLMSATTFVASLPGATDSARGPFNSQLERRRDDLPSDYVRTDTEDELWRVSERLAALNDVDFGEFLHRQKLAIEPILTAYRFRDSILRELDTWDVPNFTRKKILLLGFPRGGTSKEAADSNEHGPQSGEAVAAAHNEIDQTDIFCSTLRELLEVPGCRIGRVDPNKPHPEGLPPVDKLVDLSDCVVLLQDHADYDVAALREKSKLFIDARDHEFDLASSKTAAELGDPIQVVYTGVVPVVYKAQRTLLDSLVESIAMAFVMIAGVMMVLLRDWQRPISITNTINPFAGMVAMVPNVFPVVIIFGWMGHRGTMVDIGTMMCASVAMGVAVDDTIHYLTWFRIGMQNGLSRNDAILEAYRRVATAMTQTTLIGGLGLAVFALSTFTPTQRFGVMMVTLLAAALVGDLVLLPALLAGPLGRFFAVSEKKTAEPPVSEEKIVEKVAPSNTAETQGATRHSAAIQSVRGVHRPDQNHNWPRH